jgi:hypothetical protein
MFNGDEIGEIGEIGVAAPVARELMERMAEEILLGPDRVAAEMDAEWEARDTGLHPCPRCGRGKNSPKSGGHARCFHCDACSYRACEEVHPPCWRCASFTDDDAGMPHCRTGETSDMLADFSCFEPRGGTSGE